MDLVIIVLMIVMIGSILYLIILQKKFSSKINPFYKQNSQLLESIEKYVEIFNEQNVNELLEPTNNDLNIKSRKIIEAIRDEYRLKLIKNDELSEEHEMLIDFISLTLSLLVKTPPNLREKIILDNTDNDFIKKILISKLPEIKNLYIPVSILEVALSKQKS